MDAFADIARTAGLNALGYALLNSLWQGAIIFVIVAGLLRAVPQRYSNARYAITLGGLGAMVLTSIVTFFILFENLPQPVKSSPGVGFSSAYYEFSGDNFGHYLLTAKAMITNLLPSFMLIWMLGAILFNLRLAAGLVYLDRLRKQSAPIVNEWHELLQRVSSKLAISRKILLAESPSITAPIVIGFLKPMILIPVGMFSGLSASQVETIFMHELMHIRRQDYIINMIQSFIEAIFFFNPFVWMISVAIKREREHCCDDAVIAIHGNPKDYVMALASLEEARLARIPATLSFAENKHHLLNRIKRIMEKSVKTPLRIEKAIPALLIVLGLLCASWISIRTSEHEDHSGKSFTATVQDTTKKKNKATVKTQSKKDKVAAPAKPEMPKQTPDPSKHGDVTELASPPFPPVPNFDFEMDFQNDGLYAFGETNEKLWREFGEEFEKGFKDKFQEFYARNHEQIQKLMDETEKRINEKFGPDWEARMEDFAVKQEEWAKKHAEWAAKHAEKWSNYANRFDTAFFRLEDKLERLKIDLPDPVFEEGRLHLEENMKHLQESIDRLRERHKKLEDSLLPELVEDGYLEEGEGVRTMHWHNGTIEVNGKEIKPEHQEKYNRIREKIYNSVD